MWITYFRAFDWFFLIAIFLTLAVFLVRFSKMELVGRDREDCCGGCDHEHDLLLLTTSKKSQLHLEDIHHLRDEVMINLQDNLASMDLLLTWTILPVSLNHRI